MSECGKCGDLVRVPDGYEFDGTCWDCERREAEALIAKLTAERDRLRESMRGVELTDRTPYYEHHEPRPDGMLPRDGRDAGTCWLTPKEIAVRALGASASREATA